MRILFFLAALLSGVRASAQTYFNERYPAPPGQQGFAHCVLPISGGYAVVGESNNGTTRQLVFRFLDSLGNVVREREYARAGYSYAAAYGNNLIALPDGGYAVPVGAYLPNGNGTTMLWRFNALGDTLWTRTYPVAPRSFAFGGCRTRDGGFAIVGEALPGGSGNRRVLLVRTDSAGVMQWQQTYRSRPLNKGFNVAQMPDGGFLIGGATYEAGGRPLLAYVIRTDSLGSSRWQRTYGDAFWPNGLAAVRPTRDGGIAVLTSVGYAEINGYGQTRAQLYKLNAQGQLIWQKAIGPKTFLMEFIVLLELPDGSLIGAGQDGDTANAQPIGNGIGQGAIFKVCANGDSLWYRNYKKLTGGFSHNYLRALAATPDGGFVGAGFLLVRAPDTGTSDGWVFKIDSAGYLQAGGPPVTVQCRQPTSTAPESLGSAIEIYPNPTLPDGRFTLEAPPGATLTLTDALGREVWRTSHLTPRTSDLKLPHPGLYLLRIFFADGRTLTRKLVR